MVCKKASFQFLYANEYTVYFLQPQLIILQFVLFCQMCEVDKFCAAIQNLVSQRVLKCPISNTLYFFYL